MGYAGCANSVLLAVLLTVAIWSGRLTCVAAEDKCVSGTCSGDVSCLRNLDTTCPLQSGGGCQTTINAGTVKAECVAACPVTTPAPTADQTTAAPTSTTTTAASGRKKRQAVAPEVTCCTTNMCNRPEKSSAAGVFSSMMTILVYILLLMHPMYI